eukprot:3773728-Amphidinium_carterae.2
METVDYKWKSTLAALPCPQMFCPKRLMVDQPPYAWKPLDRYVLAGLSKFTLHQIIDSPAWKGPLDRVGCGH